jgi:uncharacterized protein YvpB
MHKKRILYALLLFSCCLFLPQVAKANNYLAAAPTRVMFKVADYYYKDIQFKQRGNKIANGTIIPVDELVATKNGVPRLKTPYGYVTANKKYVAATKKTAYYFYGAPHYNQGANGAPMGCAHTAAYAALKYYDALPKNMTLKRWYSKNGVPRHKWNPNLGFAGDPTKHFSWATHMMIFPKAYVKYLKKFHKHTTDISGETPEQIQERVKSGQLIVHYSSSSRDKARVWKETWYNFGHGIIGNSRTHVRLIDGLRTHKGKLQYHVEDSDKYGPRWLNAIEMDRVYNATKKRAIAFSR